MTGREAVENNLYKFSDEDLTKMLVHSNLHRCCRFCVLYSVHYAKPKLNISEYPERKCCEENCVWGVKQYLGSEVEE
jgi:hypothetical protein